MKSQQKSLILVTVDCLRSDHVGFLGYSRPTTPFLDSLANDSYVFSSAIVAGAPTYYSFPPILASRYPLALGRDIVGLAPGEPSIASILSHAGYATAAFNAGNPYLSARFGYDQGFQFFRDFLDPSFWSAENNEHSNGRPSFNQRVRGIARGLGLGSVYDELYFQYMHRARKRELASFDKLRQFPDARVIVDEAVTWLRAVAGRPFFLWLHFMDPHGPYYPTDDALQLMDDADISAELAYYLNQYWNRRELPPRRLRRYRDAIVCLYDGGIRWVDVQIGNLVHAVKDLGKWDDCIFACTADHGEEFLEHGGRFHPQWSGKEELVHVPLLVRFPELGALRTDAVFSQIDLPPTLLQAMNISVPPQFQGRSRLDELRSSTCSDEPVVIECTEAINPSRPQDRLSPRVLCIRDRKYKLVLRFGSQEQELYDLENDPAEQRPIGEGRETAVRRRFLELAREHLGRAATGAESYQMSAKIRNFRHGELMCQSQ